MARDRMRPSNPDVRRDNETRIMGNPGRGGRAKIGAAGGQPTVRASQPIVVAGRGNDIQHVTLLAEASQTIAAGASDLGFDRIAGAPTEVRGFPTLLERLATGTVFAIPIDVTGWGHLFYRRLFASWRQSGQVEVRILRGGQQLNHYVPMVGPPTRFFEEPMGRFWLQANDTLAIREPNTSGVAQALDADNPGWVDLTVFSDAPGTSGAGTSSQVHVYVSSDNDSIVYLDGQQVLATAAGGGGADAVVPMGSGQHVVAIEGVNLTSAPPNPAYVQLAIYDYSTGADGALLFTTNLADWDCQDYPGSPPAGWPSVGGSSETWTAVHEQSTSGFSPIPEPSAKKLWSRADATAQPVGTSYFRGVFST